MGKGSDEKSHEDLVATYKLQVLKLTVLSKVAVRQFMGTRPDGDPRVEYLTNMETFKNLSNVYLEVMMDLISTKLGIPKEAVLKAYHDQLAVHIETLEKDLCVTSYDPQGNPVFDLPSYREMTKEWPV